MVRIDIHTFLAYIVIFVTLGFLLYVFVIQSRIIFTTLCQIRETHTHTHTRTHSVHLKIVFYLMHETFRHAVDMR